MHDEYERARRVIEELAEDDLFDAAHVVLHDNYNQRVYNAGPYGSSKDSWYCVIGSGRCLDSLIRRFGYIRGAKDEDSAQIIGELSIRERWGTFLDTLNVRVRAEVRTLYEELEDELEEEEPRLDSRESSERTNWQEESY